MQTLICAPLNKQDLQKIKNECPFCNFLVTRQVTQNIIEQVDIIIGNPPISLNLNQEHLQAILLNSAGSDQYIQKNILHPNTHLTNASGSYGIAIAEHIIGTMITFNKNFKTYIKQMDQHLWQPIKTGKEIYHAHVLIVGYGDIGYETAKRLKAFDCHITAIKRRKQNNLPYVDEFYSIDELDSQLPKADYVILSLPQNPSTIHLINKDRLLLMKKDAMLINVGRGSSIVTSDLIDVLKQGHLYAVALDVLEQEPLLSDSPLWNFDNVLITPHSSGGFVWQSVHDYYVDLVIKNLHHLHNHELLENEVDFQTGYRKNVVYK